MVRCLIICDKRGQVLEFVLEYLRYNDDYVQLLFI